MIEGHGDDAYKYKAIKINFSSNVYNHVSHLFNSSDIQESDFGYLDAHFQRICGCLSSAWS